MLIVALLVGFGVAGFLLIVRNPREMTSLIRNPREHLFGKSDYTGGDDTGMLWEPAAMGDIQSSRFSVRTPELLPHSRWERGGIFPNLSGKQRHRFTRVLHRGSQRVA